MDRFCRVIAVGCFLCAVFATVAAPARAEGAPLTAEQRAEIKGDLNTAISAERTAAAEFGVKGEKEALFAFDAGMKAIESARNTLAAVPGYLGMPLWSDVNQAWIWDGEANTELQKTDRTAAETTQALADMAKALPYKKAALADLTTTASSSLHLNCPSSVPHPQSIQITITGNSSSKPATVDWTMPDGQEVSHTAIPDSTDPAIEHDAISYYIAGTVKIVVTTSKGQTATCEVAYT